MAESRKSGRTAAGRFPTTHWSMILRGSDLATPEGRERVDRLCRSYWAPVYAYIRIRWHKSPQDAEDLTQAFFTLILTREYLARLRPERGSFRGFLKRALKNFLIDDKRAFEVRKSVRRTLRLDDGERADLERSLASADASPDKAYDREWARCVVRGALQDLEKALARAGKQAYFEAFQAYYRTDPSASDPETCAGFLRKEESGRPTYRDIGARVAMSESEVRNRLYYCRRVLERCLHRRIRDTVENDLQADVELFQLLRL